MADAAAAIALSASSEDSAGTSRVPGKAASRTAPSRSSSTSAGTSSSTPANAASSRSGASGQSIIRVRGGCSRTIGPRCDGALGASRSKPSSRRISHTPVRFSGVSVSPSASAISVTERPSRRGRSTSARAAAFAAAVRGPGRRSTKKLVACASKSLTSATIVDGA